MMLEIVTPVSIAVREDDVVSVRAEDASGGFGIWPGHADLITVLAVSVVSWHRRDSVKRHCAVRGGVLTVRAGKHVALATQEAVTGEDLKGLERDVIERLRATDEAIRNARMHARRLHVAALDQLLRYARPSALPEAPGRLAARTSRHGEGKE